MDTDYLGKPLEAYLAGLASRAPAPGGGSAAALALALAAALLSMVARFSLGKKKLAAAADEIGGILVLTESIRAQAARRVEEDSRVYLAWREAAARSPEDPGRAAAMAGAAAAADRFLLETARLAPQLLGPAEVLLARGNPRLASDVACAAHLLRAACGALEATEAANRGGGAGAPGDAGPGVEIRRLRALVEEQTGRLLSACEGRP